ncbi:hypothetical protein EVAR_2412_1 [Eumeta japonica]|uniref:Uncharacterized protein n=1 Tax=Eumeta variegata TaxID=151549 RepID=A0A4C1SR39_EUMVA|nr:hypothetical protein EVAR_2412_1 [Eumeta japonica]
MQAARHRATTDVQSALVRPRLPDSEVSDAPRAYHARTAGRLPGHRGTITLPEPMLRGPSSIGKTTQTRAGARRGHRLADACVAEPSPPSSTPLRNPVPPPAAERMRNDARAAGGPAWHRIED